jgi:hypothetical protein
MSSVGRGQVGLLAAISVAIAFLFPFFHFRSDRAECREELARQEKNVRELRRTIERLERDLSASSDKTVAPNEFSRVVLVTLLQVQSKIDPIEPLKGPMSGANENDEEGNWSEGYGAVKKFQELLSGNLEVENQAVVNSYVDQAVDYYELLPVDDRAGVHVIRDELLGQLVQGARDELEGLDAHQQQVVGDRMESDEFLATLEAFAFLKAIHYVRALSMIDTEPPVLP